MASRPHRTRDRDDKSVACRYFVQRGDSRGGGCEVGIDEDCTGMTDCAWGSAPDLSHSASWNEPCVLARRRGIWPVVTPRTKGE